MPALASSRSDRIAHTYTYIYADAYAHDAFFYVAIYIIDHDRYPSAS